MERVSQALRLIGFALFTAGCSLAIDGVGLTEPVVGDGTSAPMGDVTPGGESGSGEAGAPAGESCTAGDSEASASGFTGTIPGSSSSVIENVTFDGLHLIGYVAPRSSQEIKTSRWGMNILKASASADYMDRLAKSGIKWARAYGVDEGVINALRERQIRVFVTFPNASGSAAEWAAGAKNTVLKYKGKVAGWEIFNEPNWKGELKAPSAYAPFVKAGFEAVKAADPNALVIAGATAHVDSNFLKGLLALGMGAYMDVFTIHPYSSRPEYDLLDRDGVGFPEDFNYMKSTLSSAIPPIALWQGECGYPTTGGGSGWNGPGPWSERIQQKWLTRRCLTDLRENLGVTAYFNFTDTGVRTKGLVKENNPKPAYFTLANITSIYDERFHVVKQPIAAFTILSPGAFPAAMTEKIRSVAAGGGSHGDAFAYWLPLPLSNTSSAARVGLRLSKVTMVDQPVAVSLTDGRIYEVPVTVEKDGTLIFSSLPLTDYAFAIVSKSALKMQPDPME